MSTETLASAQATPQAVSPSPAPEVKADQAAAPAAVGQAQAPVAGQTPEPKAPEAPKEFTLKMPEGSLLDAGVVEKISSFAKEKGLSQEVAQSFLEAQSEAVSSFQKGQTEAHEKAVKELWPNQLKADPDFGGEKYLANVEVAKSVIDKFGDADFKDALDKSGLGNHPGLVKFCHKLGKAMKADSFVHAGAQPEPTQRMADVFYPNMKKD